MYRQNVGILLKNKEGLIFVGLRNDIEELTHWQMPQGGIDGNEIIEAMYRELWEEIGLFPEHVEIIKQIPEKIRYDFPLDLIPKLREDMRYFKGQEQTWFILNFLGEDENIDLNASDHPEFSEWKWATKGFLLENCLSWKKDVYRKVFEYC